MKVQSDKKAKRPGVAAIALGALALVGLPSAGFAIGAIDSPRSLSVDDGFSVFTPAAADPRVAELVAARGNSAARLGRFTPAGAAEGESRSVTVAVRVDQESARAFSVRSAIAAAKDRAAPEAGVRITPTRFSLGVSHDYQSFSRSTPVLSTSLSEAGMPDLSEFRPSEGVKEKPSRFAARIELEEGKNAGSAPRTIDGAGEQTVDLGGSYRLTRNLDVTAGVRYSQERDRVLPIAEPGQNQSQAVYIGTEFRF